jgi:DNA-directed RNA polymerase specialized sigma24 family protein
LTGTVLASKDGVDVNLLTDALEELKGMEPAYAHVAELKIASNLTGDEIAEHLGIGARTVDKYWALGRAWISRKLQEGAHS